MCGAPKTANVVLPILGSIAVAIKQSPLLLMIPGTISCSYAFMLPVATPPNAVIFAYGHFTVGPSVLALASRKKGEEGGQLTLTPCSLYRSWTW